MLLLTPGQQRLGGYERELEIAFSEQKHDNCGIIIKACVGELRKTQQITAVLVVKSLFLVDYTVAKLLQYI